MKLYVEETDAKPLRIEEGFQRILARIAKEQTAEVAISDPRVAFVTFPSGLVKAFITVAVA